MAKSYTEELAAWVEKKAAKKRRLDATAVQFLTVKVDVKAALDAGYSVTTIWEHMHETGRVSFRYETFLRHVRRHITNAPSETPRSSATAKPTAQGKCGNESMPTASHEPKKSEVSPVGRFNFDPTPKKEELL